MIRAGHALKTEALSAHFRIPIVPAGSRIAMLNTITVNQAMSAEIYIAPLAI